MGNITHYDSIDFIENLVKNVFRPASYDTTRRPQHQSDDDWREARLIRMDVVETEHAYKVSAELPGINKDDVSVVIDSNRVQLTAECHREKSSSDDSERTLSAERFYGKLRRSLQLPEEINEENAEAKFREGLLELTLPKKPSKGTKKLVIK